MAERRHTSTKAQSAALFVSGVSIGLLLGLAVSPTLHLIVGAIAALIGGIVGALAGVQSASPEEERPRRFVSVSPLPFTVLVLGLAVGAPIGIFVRTNDVFGPRPGVFARRWSGTGLTAEQVQLRLFDHLYPADGAARHSGAGLYTASADDCALLALKQGSELRSRLRALGDARVAAAAERCGDDPCLDALRTLLCADVR